MNSQDPAAGQLLLDPATRITCPECGVEFGLERGFARRALEAVEESSRGTFRRLQESERADAERRNALIAAQRDASARAESDLLRKMLTEQGAAHQKALAEAQALARQSIEPQLQTLRSALAERAAEHADFQRQLQEREAQVASLRAEQLSLRKEREQLKDQKDALELEVRRQVDLQVQQREAAIRTQEAERARLREAELQKKLDDVGSQLAEAQRKAEQGSQQLQGEVLELALEESLVRVFKLDAIEEVRKGVRGGDVIQRVMTRAGQAAGIMLWETKRARDWSPQWVGKLKEDMRAVSADIGILVTMPSATPRDWEAHQPFGLHEEIWVTTWSHALGLAEVLRSGLLDVHKQRLSAAGKGEKMEAVYDYLTSAQFAQKLKAVYNAFKGMKDENDRERLQAEQRWARRDKQLQTAMRELVGIGGDIQGLAQQDLPQLELDGSSDDQPRLL